MDIKNVLFADGRLQVNNNNCTMQLIMYCNISQVLSVVVQCTHVYNY